jgi:D-alanyl-lipoteichoic acid acyltransferase DltB (MBOAT superfamily)
VLFPTIEFALFFPIVFVVSWLLRPNPRVWKLFMVVASAFFYTGYVRYQRWHIAVLAGVIIANQVFVRAIASSRHRAVARIWVGVAVTLDISCLAFFKYYAFADKTLTSAHVSGLPHWRFIAPLAISFFVFQAISYVVDTYRETVVPGSLLDTAVYLSFFPHLGSGPIVRAYEFLPQLHEHPDPRRIDSSRAFRLIVVGMFKKVVIADYLNKAIVEQVFANPNAHSSQEILVAIYGYAVRIYADFSGYTDMAIGLALLLGIRFPQNFNAPYTARSLQDFWRRWHMTLSRFLRDYLYIGLGGSRHGRLATYRNLMLTMVIGGLWHGSSWTFVVWGAIHGFALAVERFLRDRRHDLGLPAPPVTPARSLLQWLVTFHVVCLAWVFFNSRTFTGAADMLRGLFRFGDSPLVTPLVLAIIAGALLAQFVPENLMGRLQQGFSYLPLWIQGTSIAIGLFAIYHLSDKVQDFIYFQFS